MGLSMVMQVFGVPDLKRGEVLCAWVKLRCGQPPPDEHCALLVAVGVWLLESRQSTHGTSGRPPLPHSRPAPLLTLTHVLAGTCRESHNGVRESDLRAWCTGHIANHKVPRYWKLVDSFPMTVRCVYSLQVLKWRAALFRLVREQLCCQ